MNIQISYNWLKEYTKTTKTAKEVADLLSLHSMSVEYIKEVESEKVFDIEITTNRPDAMSVIGLARELAVLLGKSLDIKEVKLPKVTSKGLKVTVSDKTACPRYIGAIFEDVKVKDSSKTIQKRLKQAGLRPINNIVDVTNYIMLETGNPMHAFDASDGLNEIKIRKAKPGETMVTLDGQKLDLTEEDLMITDKDKLLGLAGIKGGKEREVNSKTKRIILESANFLASGIRASSQRHNLITDASVRFTKSIPVATAELAMVKAIQLLEKEAGAKLVGLIDQKFTLKPVKITLTKNKLDSLLGLDFSWTKAIKILKNLGFTVSGKTAVKLVVQVPVWRQGDVEIEEGLIEEIARVYGYHNLPQVPLTGQLPSWHDDKLLKLTKRVKHLLCNLGFTESYTYSVTSQKIAGEGSIALKNPLSRDFQNLRRDLTTSLLPVIAKNQRQIEKLSIFELSKVYVKPKKIGLPQEITRLCVLSKQFKFNPKAFYDLKAVLERIIKVFGLTKITYKRMGSCCLWQSLDSAEVYVNDELIGVIGWLKDKTIRSFGVKTKVVGFDISIDKLVELYNPQKSYHGLSKFPAVRRDLSMLIPRDRLWEKVANVIKDAGQPYLTNLEVFDVYSGKGITPNTRSVSVHLEFRSSQRTLKDTEVDKAQSKIVKALANQGIKIRKR